MISAALLVAALLLDAIFGEPKWLWSRFPHPAVIMGGLVGWLDAKVNNRQYRRLKGIVAMTVLVTLAGCAGLLISALPGAPVIEVLLAAILLAHRSLVDHVSAVANALDTSLPEGRKSVAHIVSRDTAEMDQSAIARSAIESAAENFSDGVIAPVFWFLILGLPGLLIYKITNTADSMIGYRTPRHADFGWAAARFDDLLNWIPARLSAMLIVAAFLQPKAWQIIRRDAPLHRSPNAGWPEAAIAAVLNITLAGPRRYDGEMRDFAWVNPQGRHDLGARDINASVSALWRSWCLTLALVVILAVV